MQVSILRLLESNEIRMIGGVGNRKVECRIVIAPNIDLKNAVKEKKIREDLYFRLTRLEINIPPLREKITDISDLVNYFLHGSTGLSGKQKTISSEMLKVFSVYQWPGNIRELKNCIDGLKKLNPEKEELNVEDLNFIQIQGEISLPKNLKKLNIESSPSLGSVEIKEDSQLNEDPNLRIINQKGFKSEKRLLLFKTIISKIK
jgi:transcriptional regulator with PAS, ATPase and Fis domain